MGNTMRSRQAGADGGFAMLTVILLIMVCATVSVLMLGVVVAQVKPTVFEAKSTRTISAAEAGVDATLGQFRTATTVDANNNRYGSPALLPCAAGTWAGAVGGLVGAGTLTLRYDVAIRYYGTSPANQSEAWRDSNKIKCADGGGLARPPQFALITSQGSDAAVGGYGASVGNRTLESIYTFQMTNSTINGGVIYDYSASACLQADAQTVPPVPWLIHYVVAATCRVDDASRLWSYGTDYSIRLSVTDLAGSTPMCITGSSGNATLQKCDGRNDQKFGWQWNATWSGQKSDNSGPAAAYLGTGSSLLDPKNGPALTVTAYTDTRQDWSSFNPDPRVGAGAAGYSTNQVVNFLQFGRCFDVTHANIAESNVPNTMILYPCKQNPIAPGSPGSGVEWNQQWYYTEPDPLVGSVTGQQIKVINGKGSDGGGVNGATYCLTTPAPAPTGTYPTLSLCSTSDDQKWNRTAKAGTYADSWLFTDRYGRCIGLGDVLNTGSDPWNQMTVAKCTGGPEQKWNAPPNAQSASLDNFKELN